MLIFHGGHMRAGIALGEQPFVDLGMTVLVPSRPGYGRTSTRFGNSPEECADLAAELCATLGVEVLDAVVGISAGGPVAVAMAARHPDLVRKLILECAVSALLYPDRWTRIGATIAFNAVTERVTWAAVRALLKHTDRGLELMLGGLTTEQPKTMITRLTAEERTLITALFTQMRSGRGFIMDIHRAVDPALESAVAQPTLIMATRHDAGVTFNHATHLASTIPNAVLRTVEADSHLIWFGPAAADAHRTVTSFLRDAEPPRT